LVDLLHKTLLIFRREQERLWVRNGTSAANLNTLAHISALAVALAAVLHGSHSYRSAKQLRRSA
jgi:hypothetical protein